MICRCYGYGLGTKTTHVQYSKDQGLGEKIPTFPYEIVTYEICLFTCDLIIFT